MATIGVLTIAIPAFADYLLDLKHLQAPDVIDALDDPLYVHAEVHSAFRIGVSPSYLSLSLQDNF